MPVVTDEYQIKSSDFVLDIGGGHNPFYRSDVVMDLFPDDDEQRGGHLNIGDRFFVEGDGVQLPFKAKVFDYIWSNHTIEHSSDPIAFAQELSRTGMRGYLGAPSELYEIFFDGPDYHQWIMAKVGDEIVACKKDKSFKSQSRLFGVLIQMLYQESPSFQKFYRSHFNLFKVNINWQDEVIARIVQTWPILNYQNEELMQEMVCHYPEYVPVKHENRLQALDKTVLIKAMRCLACDGDLSEQKNHLVCETHGQVYRIKNQRFFYKV